ncbi:MAG: sigma-70 family RNA polymerase sigma factor [Phycisphaerales bacterium]|jgi:RNA polymerase sigma factor (sigma-70 family)
MCIHNHTESGFGSPPEAAPFYQAQAGCRDSLNRLMAQHEGLVQVVVRQQVLGDLTFDEALQAGRTGLWRAILGFEPSRGLAFSTYAFPCIKHQIWRAVKVHSRFYAGRATNVESRGLSASADDPVSEPAVVCEKMAIHQALLDLVRRLPRRLRYVISARYGLDGHEPSLYRHIGARLGLTGERARQLHTEALVWLRHPGHSYQLRSLLGGHTMEAYETADALAQQWLRRRGGRHGR